jgi:hypothetical protein
MICNRTWVLFFVTLLNLMNMLIYVARSNTDESKSCACDDANRRSSSKSSPSIVTTSTSTTPWLQHSEELGSVDEEPKYVNRIIEVQRRLLYSCNEKIATLEVSTTTTEMSKAFTLAVV